MNWLKIHMLSSDENSVSHINKDLFFKYSISMVISYNVRGIVLNTMS